MPSELIMKRVPRRLKRLNLEKQSVGHHEGDEETSMFNSDDLDEGEAQFNDDTLQLHLEDHDEGNVHIEECNEEDQPETDDIVPTLPPAAKRPINIIMPNGEVRHVLGDFKVKNMEQLKEGKVFVETDENGVPNDRSGSVLGSYIGQLAHNSTFAPLHIPKWNDKLFLEPHKSIITDVEMKFVYPSETMQLTRDWILMKASKAWRSYKSRLKKKYFNPDERSLNDILKDVPEGVNEFQWAALLSIWSKEQHKKLCEKNSECAKQQKNPHTTGRKSHARLCKEMMEARKNGKVHDIDVWDEAHKKKDPQMKAAMEMAYNELAKRKTSNFGSLSCKDYDEVFRSVVGKKTKLQGYYDHKNYSRFNVSQRSAVVGESEQERMLKLELKKVGSQVEHLTDDVSLMRAFIEQKFPGADWRNIIAAGVSKEVDTSEQADGYNIEFENISCSPNDVEEELHSFSYAKLKGGGSDTQYVPHEHTVAKQPSMGSSAKMSKATFRSMEPNMSHVNEGNKTDIFEQAENDITNGSARNDSQANGNDIPNEVQLPSFSSARDNMSYSGNVLAKGASFVISTQKTKSNRSYVEPIVAHDKAIQPLSEGSSIQRLRTSQMHVELTPPRNYGIREGDIFYRTDNDTTSGFTDNLQDSHADGSNVRSNVELNSMVSTGPNESYSTKALANQCMIGKKQGTESFTKRPHSSVQSALSHDKVIQVPQRKRVQHDPSPKLDQREVYLFSLNSAYRGKPVAKGKLVSSDSTYVVGGNMLGDEYYGVAVTAVTSIGDERMPRPLENRITVKDAIGCVIAWPRFYVKKPKINPAH